MAYDNVILCLSKKKILNVYLKVLFIIPVLSLWIWAFIVEPHLMIEVDDVDVYLPKWERKLDGLKIVVAGDIHAAGYFYEDWRIEKIVDEINAQNPDLVIMLGDYVNGAVYQSSYELAQFSKRLSNIKAPYGVYTILGNHDYLYGIEKIRKMLNKAGINIVENSNVKITTNDGEFYIAGIADAYEASYSFSEAMKGIPKGSSVIFLSHTPQVFREIPKEVAIMISGHTHGGQVRLPLLGAVLSNTHERDKLISGYYSIEGKHVYVSRGLGTSRVPIRFMCPPSITVMNVFSKK